MSRLLYSVALGLKDVKQVRGRSIFLAMQVAFVTLLLSVGGAQVSSSLVDIRSADALQAQHAVYFLPLYLKDSASPTGGASRDLLKEHFDLNPNAYSIASARIDGADPVARGTSLVALGAFGRAFGLPISPTSEPYAVVGSGRPDVAVGSSFSWHGTRVTVRERLEQNSGYLDPWMGFTNLDSTVLIVSSVNAFANEAIPSEWEEVLSRSVVLGGRTDVTSAFTTAAEATGGLALIPVTIEDKIDGDFGSELAGRIFFLLVFATAAMAILVGIVAGVMSLLQKRSRSLTVHRLLGANGALMAVRLSVFAVLAWLLPALTAVFVVARAMGPNALGSAVFVAFAALGFTTLIIVLATASVVLRGRWIPHRKGMN